MKVLVIGMTDNPGGMESVVMNYWRRMDRNRIQFDFLSYFPRIAYQEELEREGARCYVIPRKGGNLRTYGKALRSFYEAHRGEYTAIWYNTCSLANIDFLVAAKRTGIPGRIVHAHNAQNEASKIKGLFHCINRHRIAAYATEFWSCSDNAAAYFYPESVRTSASFWMVNNAIDLERFAFKEDAREKVREEFALSPDILVVGHVGRFSPQKNHSFLLEIFAKILKKRPDAKLLLVGQGELEEGIREKAKELGVLDDVIFTGARSDVEALLSAMDVFLFPSLFEGLPLALLEAQAEGLPCYTTAHTVPKEADMTGLVHYLELSAPPDAWAESVLSTWKEKSRFGSYDERIRAHGYDIRQEAALLQQKLMEISENNRDNRE